MEVKELTLQEMKEVNGGLLGLLGNGSTSLMTALRGGLSISYSDGNDNTTSASIGFGLDSMLGLKYMD